MPIRQKKEIGRQQNSNKIDIFLYIFQLNLRIKISTQFFIELRIIIPSLSINLDYEIPNNVLTLLKMCFLRKLNFS